MASANVIELLIVDDIPETRDNLKKLLYFEDDIQVIGTGKSGEEAIELVKELRPEVVLMDINMPGMDGISTVEHILREAPGTQVIMMSVQGETDYLRRSMLAGAREFLIKPFTSEELIASVRRVHKLGGGQNKGDQVPAGQQSGTQAPRKSDRQARGAAPSAFGTGRTNGQESHVICGFGAKGGVGTSTILVNTAIALREARPDARTVILDLDLQFGSIDVLLNLDSERSLLDLASHIEEADAQFVEDLLVTHTSGLRILMPPPSPADAERITADVIKQTLQMLREQFDYILIDTRTDLSDIVLAAMDDADTVLLFTTPEIPAVKNAKTFFDVASQLDYPESKIVLVLNKYDQRTGISADAIKNSIRYPITATIPADSHVTNVAVNQGVPFALNQSRTEVAREVIRLANTLARRLEPEAGPDGAGERERGRDTKKKQAEQKRSLFSRLFGR